MKLLLKVWTKVGCHLAESIARCVSHSRVLQQQQICSHCIFSNHRYTQQFDKNLAIPTRQQTFGNICHWSFHVYFTIAVFTAYAQFGDEALINVDAVLLQNVPVKM